MHVNNEIFNKYIDYKNRKYDLYAFAKYEILLDYLSRFNCNKLKILNVGCGSGEINYLLSLNQNWFIDGIDSDPMAIKLSEQEKNRYHLKNIRLFNISLQEFYSHNMNKYDVIVANDVLEHIKDDSQAVKIIYHLLNENGIFVLSVPALPVLYGYHDEILGHFRRYTKHALLKYLIKFFRIELLRYFGFFLIPVSLIISRILRRPFPINQSTFSNPFLKILISIEKKINPPLGTSLLCICKKK